MVCSSITSTELFSLHIPQISALICTGRQDRLHLSPWWEIKAFICFLNTETLALSSLTAGIPVYSGCTSQTVNV